MINSNKHIWWSKKADIVHSIISALEDETMIEADMEFKLQIGRQDFNTSRI